jgi:hypothetical protein
MPMGILQSQVGLVALWAAAGLASLWVLGPLFLFLTPLRRCDTEVRDDPREVEPQGKDPDYDLRFAELNALGFLPVGKTRERFRFFTPLHWLWVSKGSRWFASPDRRVYVEIYRLASGFPQRMCASTIFEGGGLLATSTAPLGMGGEIGEHYRRVEVGAETVAELVREHELHVADFSREVGLRDKAGTLAEVAAETRVLSKPFVSRNRFIGLYAIAAIYVMPVWTVIGTMGRARRALWLPPAAFCGFAALFALLRLVALPEFRRVRWLAFTGLMALALGVPLLSARLRPRHRLDHRVGAQTSDVTATTPSAHP